MIEDPQQIAEIFIATVRNRYENGDLESGEHTPESLYCIQPGDFETLPLWRAK